jgi:hypothetical protein
LHTRRPDLEIGSGARTIVVCFFVERMLHTLLTTNGSDVLVATAVAESADVPAF